MRAILLLATLAFVPPDRPDPTPKEVPKTVHDQLLGVWRIEKMSVGSDGMNLAPDSEGRTLQFNRTEILVAVNDKPQPNDHTGYTIDLSRSPIAIDILPRNGPEKKMEGILKLEGDQLTMCFAAVGTRPANFSTKGPELTVLMQMKRIKK